MQSAWPRSRGLAPAMPALTCPSVGQNAAWPSGSAPRTWRAWPPAEASISMEGSQARHVTQCRVRQRHADQTVGQRRDRQSDAGTTLRERNLRGANDVDDQCLDEDRFDEPAGLKQ